MRSVGLEGEAVRLVSRGQTDGADVVRPGTLLLRERSPTPTPTTASHTPTTTYHPVRDIRVQLNGQATPRDHGVASMCPTKRAVSHLALEVKKSVPSEVLLQVH